MKYKVKNLDKTCLACPTIWEGQTQDGKEILIRFRWGTLRCDIDNKTVYEQKIEHGFMGVIDIITVKEKLSNVLEF